MRIQSTDLYGTRVLVFMEEEVDTNRYRQVLLTPEEFKRVSDQIGRVTKQFSDGYQEVELSLSEEVYELPDLKQIHVDESESEEGGL